MTEDEAKTKWCPMARVKASSDFAYNRDFDGEVFKNSMCIGSACMMWRWIPRFSPDKVDLEMTKRGYCGLAA